MKARNLYFLFLVAVLAFGLLTSGCSGKSNILQAISGAWQDNQDKSPVEIQLTGDSKSVTLKSKPYPVSVDKIDEMNNLVSLKVQNGGAQPEVWTLQQIWDENGSSFKLTFNHNGEKEVLIPKQQS
jgi:hypothetical protein